MGCFIFLVSAPTFHPVLICIVFLSVIVVRVSKCWSDNITTNSTLLRFCFRSRRSGSMCRLCVSYDTAIVFANVPVSICVTMPCACEIMSNGSDISTLTSCIASMIVRMCYFNIGYITAVSFANVPMTSGILLPSIGKIMRNGSYISANAGGITSVVENMLSFRLGSSTSLIFASVPMIVIIVAVGA